MIADIAPLDPDSPRGRELATALTLLLDEVEDAINERAKAAEHANERHDAAA